MNDAVLTRSSRTATDDFAPRHLGPSEPEMAQMLGQLGVHSLEELASAVVPDDIRLAEPPALPEALNEHEALERLRAIAGRNKVVRSLLGTGYHATITPPVIQRHIFENPHWYTPYTPYQAEVSQGRLEALLNFQTMVSDLTGMEVANASLLDEATAAAEAMAMAHAIARGKKPAFFAADDCHPQTLGVMRTRARSLGIELRIGPPSEADFDSGELSGVLLQYPTTDGRVEDYDDIVAQAHEAKAMVIVSADLLSLTLLRPPGEFGGGGADVVVGSAQRFGVPMGYGGPHAAYMATRSKHVRKMPGRLVGVSVDSQGKPALRLAIQTREQHIKREKATSNICTAQVLLAVLAGMYGVWHGPEGLTRIARRVHALASLLAAGLRRQGHDVPHDAIFDTVRVEPENGRARPYYQAAAERGINLRLLDEQTLTISLDEVSDEAEVDRLLAIFGGGGEPDFTCEQLLDELEPEVPERFARLSSFMEHPVFHEHHSETDMMRYITRLERKDIALTRSMIPLGSCTMKLNAAAEMLPITWPEFARLHPHAPQEQAQGYRQMMDELEQWLAAITGLHSVSLQPNAGSQGEFAGLLAIRRYQQARGEGQRNICLIPTSAHGTNPASAITAGLKVVAVACNERGDVDLDDLRAKAQTHKDHLSALMVTYPSTHGVFEPGIREVCRIIHEAGGQVYMDGANLNAQVGLTSPAAVGADVVHLNLHKTFAIPHGGGGPGVGPIAVAEHLAEHLPGDPLTGGEGAVSAAAQGSASILPISWMYLAMMGPKGLTRASEVAILNANYMAHRLGEHYPVLYTGPRGRVAHEFILDCRAYERSAGVRVDDIARRLMDFGFHAPTMSWPVPGTLMVEPTESEPKTELDRFCDAMIAIREEIRDIEEGRIDAEQSPLRHAPHPAEVVTGDDWPFPYPRSQAAYPVEWIRESKYWPPVGRIDQAYGDRNLMCACPPVGAYGEA
ncbi:MAG: aminomethyl-transferring glycine dehydrogenase [Phycisphaeraceae bacterium]